MSENLPAHSTIAHLIETDGPGGAERVLAYLVSRLAAEGFDNVVLLPAAGEGWLAAQLPRERVEVVPVPLQDLSIARAARAVTSIIRQRRPAVVHSHEFTMSVLGAFASWRVGVPHVVTMHGSRYYASRLDRRLAMGVAARAATALIAVSQALKANLVVDLKLAPDRIRLIPNGVPKIPLIETTLRNELGLSARDILIVTVGNLYAVKGHAYLLEAISKLPHTIRSSVHVAIAGRGAEELRLRAIANDLGIADRIHLLGLRNDIPNILRSADLFALPSLSEALPLALLEAMRADLPVVASAVGEIPTVLEAGRAGKLVAPGDSAALCQAFVELLEDRVAARQLAVRAAEVVDAKYSIERMADSYLGLYDAARGGFTPPR